MVRPEDGLSRLGDGDLRWLVAAVARRRTDYDHIVALIRDKPDIIDVMLDDPQLVDKLFNDRDIVLTISPLLVFSVLVRRAHRDLQETSFTVELGPDGAVPVFDARRAASLLDDRAIRMYLAETLTSFTRTDTATVRLRGRRGFVHRTYSDLSVDDMAELSELVEEAHRYPFYQRAADVCLFLTGMFPEYVLGTGSGKEPSRSSRSGQRSLEEYEALGKEFYLKASDLAPAEERKWVGVFRSLADAFNLARKPLALIAQRYIGPERWYWFRPGLSSLG